MGPPASIRYCELGTAPTAVDNANHAVGSSDPWWQESVLFAWGDPRRGQGGWLRAAIHPNQGLANVYAWIVSQGRTVYRRQLTNEPLPSSDLLDTRVGPCSLRTLEPLLEYTLALDTEAVSVQLHWRNFHWPVSMSLNVGSARLGAGHYNMMGEATGEMRVKDAIYPVNGAGFSDHSWGVRRRHLPASRSYFCVFDPEFYLMALPVLTDEGEQHLLGYVRSEGRLGRLGSDARFGYSMRDDWVTVAGCDSYFHDEFERGYHITGKSVTESSSWAMGHGKLVHHAVAEFECGGRLGRGFLEVAHPKRMRPDQIAEAGLDASGWWLNEQ